MKLQRYYLSVFAPFSTIGTNIRAKLNLKKTVDLVKYAIIEEHTSPYPLIRDGLE